MRRRVRARAPGALLLGLQLFALWPAAALPQASAVPAPDLSGVEDAVRAAVESRRAAVAAAPGSAEAWGRYAMTLDSHRLTEPAQAAYLHAHRLDPDDFRWAYFLGTLVEFTDPAAAVGWFERALEIDEGYGPAHARLAQTLERLGRDPEARVHYARAVALAPNDPLAHLGLGNLALRAGDVDAALRHLERAYQHGSEIRAVVATLARAHQVRGHQERARELAAQARDLPRLTLRFDPRRTAVFDRAVDSGSALRRAQRYLDVEQPARALEVLEELLAADPGAIDAWIALAGIHDRLGRNEAALDAAGHALALEPERVEALALWAGALFKLRRFDEAERAARRVLARQPDNFHMLLVAAMLDGLHGRIDAMIEGLDRAWRSRTADRQLLELFARVSADVAESLVGVGRPDLARTHLERALEAALAARAPEQVVSALRTRLERVGDARRTP